jgi:aminopeptidase N
MNAGSGKNLNWFWKKWFFENAQVNLSITKVTATGKPSIIITNKGGKPLPIDLKIEFANGNVSTIHKSIEVWQKENSTVTLALPAGKKIKKITLGAVHTPDSDLKDNVWEAK